MWEKCNEKESKKKSQEGVDSDNDLVLEDANDESEGDCDKEPDNGEWRRDGYEQKICSRQTRNN